MTNTKNKRLRKKLYLGEFAVLGFEFSCVLNVDTDEGFDLFLDQFLEFIEKRDLCIGGGGNNESFSAFVYSKHRYGSVTNQDLGAITNWLQSNTSVNNIIVGQLVDANYGV